MKKFSLIILVLLSMSVTTTSQNKEIATFGGGCFWCTEAYFSQLDGVFSVVSGYSGGHTLNPTYNEVCSGSTGHAEVIQIEYDATKVDFISLLEVFFATHDPTTLNRQGGDTGTQYRSVIFFHNEKQKQEALLVIKQLTSSKAFTNAIVTEVSAFTKFYPAEKYHQDYYANNPNQPYCRAVITPKMEKFKFHFKSLIKK